MIYFWIGLTVLLVMVAIATMLRQHKHPANLCPNCDSENIHLHKEPTNTTFYEQPGAVSGGNVTVQQHYRVNGRCRACGHTFERMETDSR